MNTDPSDISSPPHDKAKPKPTLDQLLSMYPIQTSLMQNLNFYDFRNLQLAGCQVPTISSAVQKKYLMRIKCNVLKGPWGSEWECGNTPQDVFEMQPCQGVPLRPSDSTDELEKPRCHDRSDPSKCAWVCNECRDRSQWEEDQYGDFRIHYTWLCKMHSLQREGLRENACVCYDIAIGDWRCPECIQASFRLMEDRIFSAFRAMRSEVTLLGIWTFIVRPDVDRWTHWLLQQLINPQEAINRSMHWGFLSMFGFRHRSLNIVKFSRLCPIENCKHAQWDINRAMWMCLECKAIFSENHPSAWRPAPWDPF